MVEIKKQKLFKNRQPKHDEIARKAYELWEKAGREDGKNLEHWFEAERILRSHEPYPD